MHTHTTHSFGTRNTQAKVPGRTPVETANAIQASEQRSTLRRRMLKGANIYFNKGYGAYSCTVKNISDGGVMVLMEDSSGLPSEFDLKISGEAGPRKASICWRANGRAGMRFI